MIKIPYYIKDALVRADVEMSICDITATLHIRSRNLAEPLTLEEKERITFYLSGTPFLYEVVFDN